MGCLLDLIEGANDNAFNDKEKAPNDVKSPTRRFCGWVMNSLLFVSSANEHVQKYLCPMSRLAWIG